MPSRLIQLNGPTVNAGGLAEFREKCPLSPQEQTFGVCVHAPRRLADALMCRLPVSLKKKGAPRGAPDKYRLHAMFGGTL